MSTLEARSRGPYAKSTTRKAEIAQTALSIIDEVGHEALLIAEVAKRVGMSERAISYHFPTKDHLLVAALASVDVDDTIRMTDEQDRYEKGLELIPELVARAQMDHPNRARLASVITAQALDPSHPAHDYVLRHTTETIAAFEKLVRERQRLGLAHPGLDSARVARLMLSTWNGLSALWVLDPTFDLTEELKEAFYSLTGWPTMQARAIVEQALRHI